MLVLFTQYGNGYKTQDEPTIKFLEKMEQLRNTSHNLSYIRTRRPRMYQTSYRYYKP